MDKALGKIAKPLLPVFLPVDTNTAISESVTPTIG
jgi:hypothetical protein